MQYKSTAFDEKVPYVILLTVLFSVCSDDTDELTTCSCSGGELEDEFVEDTLLEEILFEEDRVSGDDVCVLVPDDEGCAGPSWCLTVITASDVEAANCVLLLERTQYLDNAYKSMKYI